jgi:hypothetical protein
MFVSVGHGRAGCGQIGIISRIWPVLTSVTRCFQAGESLTGNRKKNFQVATRLVINFTVISLPVILPLFAILCANPVRLSPCHKMHHLPGSTCITNVRNGE